MAQKLPPSSRSRPAALPRSQRGPVPPKRRKPAAAPADPPLPVAEGFVDGTPDAGRIAAFAAHRAQRPPAPPQPRGLAPQSPVPSRRAALAAFLDDEEP